MELAVAEIGEDPNIPVLDIDPYDLDYAANPYPLFEIIRETAPVVYLRKYGTYATARYEQVAAILDDWQAFTSTTGDGLQDLSLPDAFRPRSDIVEIDPPQHTKVRAACTRILSPRTLRGWREGFTKAAEVLVDQLVQSTEIDGVQDIAEAYVTTAFPPALGLAADFRDRRKLIIQGDYSFSSLGPHNEVYEKAKRNFDEIADWWRAAQLRENLDPEGFGYKLYLAEDAGDLDPGIANSLMINFFGGGLHTTIATIGLMTMHLAKRPDLWRQLRENRSMINKPFEETLRLETPTSTWYRATTRRIEFAGVTLHERRKIHLLTASANRDPRRWADPEKFEINRNTIGHLALGRGVHTCVGQMIARLEGECLLSAMLDRIETIELNGEPEIRPLNALRTLDLLPLKIKAA